MDSQQIRDTDSTAQQIGKPGLLGVAARLGDILLNSDAAVDRMFEHYGDVFRLRAPRFLEIVPGVRDVALVRDPAIIKPLFTAPDEAIDSTAANRVVEMLYGDRSLFLINGPEHRRLRKRLLPRLRGDALRQWADFIIGTTERESLSWLTRDCVRVHSRMLDVSLEVILKIALAIPGRDLPAWKASWHELLDIWGSEGAALRYAMRRLGGLRRWGRLQRALTRCNELVSAEIARRHETADRGQGDLLDLMMGADGIPLRDNELRDQVFTILLAGRDTTATTASWAIERLLRNPAAMEKRPRKLAAKTPPPMRRP